MTVCFLFSVIFIVYCKNITRVKVKVSIIIGINQIKISIDWLILQPFLYWLNTVFVVCMWCDKKYEYVYIERGKDIGLIGSINGYLTNMHRFIDRSIYCQKYIKVECSRKKQPQQHKLDAEISFVFVASSLLMYIYLLI